MTPSILFLGIGKMGLPMARHLHAAGHPVVVHDLDPERMRLAQADGLTLASDPKDALAQAAVVISSLPNDAALSGVAAWVAEATAAQIQQRLPERPTRAHARNDWVQGYGYQFWLHGENQPTMLGVYGQHLFMDRQHKAVLLITSAWPSPTVPFFTMNYARLFDDFIESLSTQTKQ